jgi:putative hydrolase of HD superfamily
MFAPPSLASKINIHHCSKMALVHDMAEALVGDITPVDGVPKTEKNRRENMTMDYFTKSLLGKVNGGITGHLVLQMVEYEKARDHKLDLGEFSWVARRIVLDEVKVWAKEILKEREEFWAGKEHTNFYDAT